MPIDYKRYPDNWKTEIVPFVLNRAGHSCELCGVENGKHLFSIPLCVREHGKYKRRMIWVSSESDAMRIQSISHRKSKIIKVVLTVAHLDHDEENHDVSYDRLKAMCQWCHLNYDAKEKYRRACNRENH